MNLRQIVKRVRDTVMPWWAAEDASHLRAIRLLELGQALPHLPADGHVLEVGAGAGWQAQAMAEAGFEVSAVDVVDDPQGLRAWPVMVYDGTRLPFDDDSFDAVFTSNTLEHVRDLSSMHDELARVLRPNGVAVHLVPSASWRAWTIPTELLTKWVPALAHGEHSSNGFSEILNFRRSWWRNVFQSCGWNVLVEAGNGLFYTGGSILGRHLGLDTREKLSRGLGQAGNLFVVTPDRSEPAP